MKLRAFFCLALLVAPLEALAFDQPRMVAEPNPGAQIRIVQEKAYAEEAREYQCISFVNFSAKTAKRVTFDFVYFDSAQRRIGHDMLVRTGTFSPNIRIDAPFGQLDSPGIYGKPRNNPYHPSTEPNCQRFSVSRSQIAEDDVTVTRVDYADGTTWP